MISDRRRELVALEIGYAVIPSALFVLSVGVVELLIGLSIHSGRGWLSWLGVAVFLTSLLLAVLRTGRILWKARSRKDLERV